MNNFEIKILIGTFALFASKILIRKYNMILHQEFKDEMINDDESYSRYIFKNKTFLLIERTVLFQLTWVFVIPVIFEIDWESIFSMNVDPHSNVHYWFSMLTIIFFSILSVVSYKESKAYLKALIISFKRPEILLRYKATLLFGETSWKIAEKAELNSKEVTQAGLHATLFHLKTDFEQKAVLIIMISIFAGMMTLKQFL